MGKYLVKVKKESVKKPKKDVKDVEAPVEELDFDSQLKMIMNTKEKEPKVKEVTPQIKTKIEIKQVPLLGRSREPVGTRGGSVSSRKTY